MIAGNEYELPYWEKQQVVIGIDEAGRGPMAGPLVVSGVVLPLNYTHEDLYDSKAISEKKREHLFTVIKEDALAYVIVIVDATEIDRLNIYKATQQAMIRCVEQINYEIYGVLSDAMPFTSGNFKAQAIIKGDQHSISIAAASILAKVTRDRIMLSYAKLYPEYGFEKHKGYPTKMHKSIIKEIGITPIHRKSYAPVAEILQPTLFSWQDEAV